MIWLRRATPWWVFTLSCLLAACSGESSTVPLDAVADTVDAVTADVGAEVVPTIDVASDDEVATPRELALTVMTFNVLCFFCDDVHYDPWEDRLVYFADIFARHQPDLIGLQELLFEDEVQGILDGAPDYAALFFEDESQSLFKDYADAAILYRKDRFEVVENGFYWLSETPEVPLSGGWADANLARLVAWALLREVESGEEFYFASTHFDNNSPNQEMSAPLFVERTREWAAQVPAIVVGDFNSKPDSPAYATLVESAEDPALTLRNAYDLAETQEVVTNLEPPPEFDPEHRIDHIFVAGQTPCSVPRWAVDMTVYGPEDRYPSDHFPMTAEILLIPR